MARNLAKISRYITDNKNRAFEWGEFDCCTMACDIIVIQGGEDFAKDVRGKYSTEVGAKRVLLEEFGSLEDAFSSLDEVDVNMVQRGDIAMFNDDGEKLMAFRYGEGYYCLGKESGIGLMKGNKTPEKAWRVS